MNETTFFNNELACLVGIEKSIILGRIFYFIEHNKNTNKHFYDGNYWIYDSAKSFSSKFPFMKEGSIYRWMRELESDGWIISGNYNKRKNDKTKWYCYGPKMLDFLSKSDSQNDSENSESLENEPKTDYQNDSESKSLYQNDRSISQNGRTNCQNDGALPIQSLSSHLPTGARFPKNPPLPDDGKRSEKFDQFWKEYPKSGKEYSAWQEWRRQRVDTLEHLFVKIMESLKRFKQSRAWKENNGRFIPFAHNWLREYRYMEMPETEKEEESIAEQIQTRWLGEGRV